MFEQNIGGNNMTLEKLTALVDELAGLKSLHFIKDDPVNVSEKLAKLVTIGESLNKEVIAAQKVVELFNLEKSLAQLKFLLPDFSWDYHIPLPWDSYVCGFIGEYGLIKLVIETYLHRTKEHIVFEGYALFNNGLLNIDNNVDVIKGDFVKVSNALKERYLLLRCSFISSDSQRAEKNDVLSLLDAYFTNDYEWGYKKTVGNKVECNDYPEYTEQFIGDTTSWINGTKIKILIWRHLYSDKLYRLTNSNWYAQVEIVYEQQAWACDAHLIHITPNTNLNKILYDITYAIKDVH